MNNEQTLIMQNLTQEYNDIRFNNAHKILIRWNIDIVNGPDDKYVEERMKWYSVAYKLYKWKSNHLIKTIENSLLHYTPTEKMQKIIEDAFKKWNNIWNFKDVDTLEPRFNLMLRERFNREHIINNMGQKYYQLFYNYYEWIINPIRDKILNTLNNGYTIERDINVNVLFIKWNDIYIENEYNIIEKDKAKEVFRNDKQLYYSWFVQPHIDFLTQNLIHGNTTYTQETDQTLKNAFHEWNEKYKYMTRFLTSQIKEEQNKLYTDLENIYKAWKLSGTGTNQQQRRRVQRQKQNQRIANECPICLDTLDATGVIHRPGCGTKFHTHCALGVQGNRCPICRKTNWIHYYP